MFVLLVGIGIGAGSGEVAQAQTESVLYSFGPAANTMSPDPYSGVVRDSKGNLYGTTWIGGTNGQGSVYKVTAKGVATVLYSFTGGADGANPIGGVVRDSSGNFYGTTSAGGVNEAGTVYELTPNGTLMVLHSFAFNNIDGWGPWATLVRDKNGNLYGTALGGGLYGEGIVFELAPDGTETILHSFGATPTDGASPNPELVRDAKGNLYGTTYNGGANGLGTVFKLSANGVETVLHSFVNDGWDGYTPEAGLVRDGKGNLYGTTFNGGALTDGTVFTVTAKGVESVLTFFDGWGGAHPFGGLIRDSNGNLYGAASGGGIDGQNGYGTVYKIVPNGTETVLHVFTGGTDDGGYPYRAPLVRDGKGNLYGTTTYGGANLGGTIYKVVP